MSGMQQRSDDRTYLGLHLSVDERRRQLDVELTRYVGVLNAEEEALRHEEWKQLSNTQKFLALRNSTLAGDIRWARANPAADIALAVRDLIYFVADMHDGCCWISARRIAELFGRSERTIREYLRRLCSHGLIRKINRPGRAQGYYPLIYRSLVGLSAQPTWFVDAFSPRKTQYGRPAGPARAEEKPRKPDAGVYGKTPEASCINPGSLLPTESTYLAYHHPKKKRVRGTCDFEDSKREVVELVEGEVLEPITALYAAGLVDDFHIQMRRLNGENALTVRGTSKDDAAKELASQIRVHDHEPSEIVAKAVKGAIIAIKGKQAKPNLGNFSSLFSKVLCSKVQEAKLQAIELQTAIAASQVKLDTEQEASRKRMGALDKAIESGETARAQRAASGNPQANKRASNLDAVISELVEKHNLQKEAVHWLRPLLSMPRHNSDPVDWALMMVETTKDLPIDALNWAAEEAAKNSKWCPTPALIREAAKWKLSRDQEDAEIEEARQRWQKTKPESTTDDDFEDWLDTNDSDVASTLRYRKYRRGNSFKWNKREAA